MIFSERQLDIGSFQARIERIEKSNAEGLYELLETVKAITYVEENKKRHLISIATASVERLERKKKRQQRTMPVKIEPKPSWMKNLKDNIFSIFTKPPFEKNNENKSKQQEEVALVDQNSNKKKP